LPVVLGARWRPR